MAGFPHQPEWVSLEEAAEAVRMSLPALRFVARRLGLALGAAQDEQGNTHLPVDRLAMLQQVASYRAQGHTVDQIERLLARSPRQSARAGHDGGSWGQGKAGENLPPARAEGRARPRPLGDEHSLPFPFRPYEAPRTSRPPTVLPLRRHEPPSRAEELQEELEALRSENRDLRARLDRLEARLNSGEPERAVAPDFGRARRDAVPTTRKEAVEAPMLAAAGAGPERMEATRMTRSPSGHVRPAVVRRWHPPALGGPS